MIKNLSDYDHLYIATNVIREEKPVFGSMISGNWLDISNILTSVTKEYVDNLVIGGSFTPTSLLVDYGFVDNSAAWDTAVLWGDHTGLYLKLDQTVPQTVINGIPNFSSGLGVNVSANAAILDVQSSGEQLRLRKDASNYFSTTVGNSGNTVFELVGTNPSFNFVNEVVITNAVATKKPLTIIPNSAQTGDVIEIQDKLGNVTFKIGADSKNSFRRYTDDNVTAVQISQLGAAPTGDFISLSTLSGNKFGINIDGKITTYGGVTPVPGDLLTGQSTTFSILAKGTPNQLLRMNSSSTAIEWAGEVDRQIVVGTGTAISSYSSFTYNSNSGTLSVIGLTGDNSLTYNGYFQILNTDQADSKVFQIKNDLTSLGIITMFTDSAKNGAFSVDAWDGNTTVKIRGNKVDHTYIQNKYVSIGRGGDSVDVGGGVDGAGLTVDNTLWSRNANTDLSNPNNYVINIRQDTDVYQGLGISFSHSSDSETNVGASIVYTPVAGKAKGKLDFYVKTSIIDADPPALALSLTENTFVSISGKIDKYNGAALTDGQILIGKTSSGTFEAATLTSGNGITVTNGSGVISIANTQTQFVSVPWSGFALPASTTKYYSVFAALSNNTLPPMKCGVPEDITVTKASVYTATAQDASGTMTFELFKNGVATGFIVTVTAGGAAGVYSQTGSIAIAADNSISWKVINSSTASAASLLSISLIYTK